MVGGIVIVFNLTGKCPHIQIKWYKIKWVIVHLFLDHTSLSIHCWIEDEGGQKYNSESELHVSASVREKNQEQ